jgi:hypothetical protein
MEKLFDELAELAKEYVFFFEKAFYSEIRDSSRNIYVSYYRSGKDYFNIYFEKFPHVNVKFFENVYSENISFDKIKFEISMKYLKNLKELIKKYRGFLKELKKEYEERKEEEKERERQREIETLESRLKELKKGSI